MSEKKEGLISRFYKVTETIRELEAEREKLDVEIIHCTDEEDKAFILKNRKKLLSMYRKYHPEFFKKFVVSCFQLHIQWVKWCSPVRRSNILLYDLLKIWDEGFVYKGNPVVSVEINFSVPIIQFINENNVIEAVREPNVEKYRNILEKLPPCPQWTERSVSDLVI